jgi:hypothetical protein
MRVPQISNEQAHVAWNAMNDAGEYDASEVAFEYIGSSEDDEVFTDIELMDLHDDLLGIIDKFSGKNKKNIGGQIDSEVVASVYNAVVGKVGVYQLSQIGFWRWLSNIANSGSFWKFVKWRFESDKQVNWGITSPGSIIEVYFYRAWLRGHKMFDANLSDPFHYAKLGSSDVWRSHILRQDFGRGLIYMTPYHLNPPLSCVGVLRGVRSSLLAGLCLLDGRTGRGLLPRQGWL